MVETKRFTLTIMIFVLLLTSLLNAKSFAAESRAVKNDRKGWSILYGVGNNLMANGTFRIGYDQWEFGKLNGWAYGAAKSFYFSKSYYTSLGLALMPTLSGGTGGFVAGIGANWEMFWSIFLRLEISENANFNANVYEQGILGLGYAF